MWTTLSSSRWVRLGIVIIILVQCIGTTIASYPTNTVTIQGVKFALLDDTLPTSTELGCQNSLVYGPAEPWKIASSTNPIHRMAVASYPWGTSCLVMEDGISLSTKTLGQCGHSQLIQSKAQYGVHDCDQRILIYLDEPVNEADFIPCYNFNGTSTPNSCDNWLFDSTGGELKWTPINELHVVHLDTDKAINITQQVDLTDTESDTLTAGFTFSITSKCYGSANHATISSQGNQVLFTMTFQDNSTETKSVDFGTQKCDDTYLEKSFSYTPTSKITSVRITLYYAPATAVQKYWKNLQISPLGNVLQNPSFSSDEFRTIPSWIPFGDGYIPDLPQVPVSNSSSLFNSLFLLSSRIEEYTYFPSGAYQAVTYGAEESVRTLYLGGYMKTYELTGVMDDNFGINLDITYKDGSHLYGQVLQFPTGTHDWIYQDAVIELSKPLASINVTVLLRAHTGAVWVDDLILTTIRNEVNTKQPCVAGVFGDPRVRTVFDAVYPFQTPGEYMLLASSSLLIQTRHVKFANGNGTLISAAAISHGSTSVNIQFDVGPEGWSGTDNVNDPTFYVNGNVVTVDDAIFLPGVGVMTKQDYVSYTPTSTRVTVQPVSPTPSPSPSPDVDPYGGINPLPPALQKEASEETISYSLEKTVQGCVCIFNFVDSQVLVHIRYLLDNEADHSSTPAKKIAGYLQIVTRMKSSVCVSVDGLVGNAAKNTLTTNTGESINVQTSNYKTIAATAVTWKLSDINSLFVYDQATSQSSSSFFQPNTPYLNPLASEFSNTCRYWAGILCDRQVLTVLNASCVEDVLYVHNNPFIVQNYHVMESQLQLTSNPLQMNVDISFSQPDDTSDAESQQRFFKLEVIAAVLISLVILALAVTFKLRKNRQARKNALLNSSVTEMSVFVDDEEQQHTNIDEDSHYD